tara:strand:+ start:287 stop:499 length:213 start_codon:yes stop_codon:yes gene_type:complete
MFKPITKKDVKKQDKKEIINRVTNNYLNQNFIDFKVNPTTESRIEILNKSLGKLTGHEVRNLLHLIKFNK